jgi:hypothetical protein
MRLQNEKLSNTSQIGDLQKAIQRLQNRQYYLWILIVIALIIGYLIGHLRK